VSGPSWIKKVAEDFPLPTVTVMVLASKLIQQSARVRLETVHQDLHTWGLSLTEKRGLRVCSTLTSLAAFCRLHFFALAVFVRSTSVVCPLLCELRVGVGGTGFVVIHRSKYPRIAMKAKRGRNFLPGSMHDAVQW